MLDRFTPELGAPKNPHYMAFHCVGMDLLGPFKKVLGGLTHLLVVDNKFTKWVEAKPLAKIGSKQVLDFIQDINFCFRVPNSIITDTSTQFTRKKFLDFCEDNNNRRTRPWSPTHPRTNE
jgi:hypothetical protein